jgi:hypothetical protein
MLKAGSSRPIQKLQIQKHHERADNRYSETKALQHAHTLALRTLSISRQRQDG